MQKNFADGLCGHRRCGCCAFLRQGRTAARAGSARKLPDSGLGAARCPHAVVALCAMALASGVDLAGGASLALRPVAPGNNSGFA